MIDKLQEGGKNKGGGLINEREFCHLNGTQPAAAAALEEEELPSLGPSSSSQLVERLNRVQRNIVTSLHAPRNRTPAEQRGERKEIKKKKKI